MFNTDWSLPLNCEACGEDLSTAPDAAVPRLGGGNAAGSAGSPSANNKAKRNGTARRL